MPTLEPEDDLRFMECCPTPPISANAYQAPLLPSTPAAPHRHHHNSFQIKRLFSFTTTTTNTTIFMMLILTNDLCKLTRHNPLLILSQTQLDYLLGYLERDVHSASLLIVSFVLVYLIVIN
jgi:hypothetical protein